MKAQPVKLNSDPDKTGYCNCNIQETTHVVIQPPCLEGSVLILPVILKGSRDRHPRQPVWSWNGDVDNPTLKPSISTTSRKGEKSHFWLNDGQCKYLGDSTHKLSGQTVDLLEVDWV